MPPKKGIETAENAWQTRIEEGQLDEEKWKVKVIMIEVGGGEQDIIYLNKFEQFATEDKRFVIKNICRTETIFMINHLGAENKVKDESCRIFEEGQTYLKEKKPIPSEVMALTIKHLILKMKDEHLFIRRQRLEVQEGMRRESVIIINKEEVRGNAFGTKPSEVFVRTPSNLKAKKADLPENPSKPNEDKKYDTVLRERGEEWRDRVYIDDFPIDGPDLYVAITGFQDPYLPVYLTKIGVPLTAVVQIHIDPSITRVPSSLMGPTKKGVSGTDLIVDKSSMFWETLQDLRIQRNIANALKNVVFIIFSPPYWDTNTLTGHPDTIYDELCYLMYDIHDLSKQHEHFLSNVGIIHIPEESRDERRCKFYHLSIDDLPLESVTIYSLLDSIMRVASKIDLDENSNYSSLSTAATLNQSPTKSNKAETKVEKAEILIREVFNTLCLTESYNKSYRIAYGDEKNKDPIVIRYGDYVKYPTFHLGNIDLENIVGQMLFGMPINQLWAYQQRPTGELEAKINFHINVLLSCFKRQDVETDELKRLIHILSFRKLFNNRSSLKKRHLAPSTIGHFKKVYLKRSVLAKPLSKCPSVRQFSNASQSFPSMTKSENMNESFTNQVEEDPESARIRFLFDCPDISELVSATEIAHNYPVSHIIEDYEFFEDFSGVTAFQVMRDAFDNYNCVDYKYCEVTDCILLMFYNSYDKDHITQNEWRSHVPTPLCLQDFFDFTLDEHYDWIKEHENIVADAITLKNQSELQDIKEFYLVGSCVEDKEVATDLLMEGSLKYQEMQQNDETSLSGSGDKIVASTNRFLSTGSDLDTIGSKKTIETPKNFRPAHLHSDVSLQESVRKGFIGYDISDRRVEVFGKESTFFSDDGTRVSSSYLLLIPENLEYITLSVFPGDSGNEFWIHRALGDFVPHEIHDECYSFRITSKDKVIMNVKRGLYEESISTVSQTNINNVKSNTSKLSHNIPGIDKITKYYHSFTVTWPNGLLTESVHENNSPKLTHIRQYYTIPHPNLQEEMRCTSLNGEVVIFKPSGNVEVLKPDGSYILITKYEKKTNSSEEETPDSDEKGKKGKSKGNKAQKFTSKTSKVNALEQKEVKPTELQMFINEFEMIETSGLRQKWINSEPFIIENLFIRTATDYCLGEIFSRRMDGTNTLLNKDGVQIVTFPDKTRIITFCVVLEEEIFPEWTESENKYFGLYDTDRDNITVKSKCSVSQKSYQLLDSVISTASKKTEEDLKVKEDEGYVYIEVVHMIEHANFTTITIDNKNGKISIDSPDGTTLSVNEENHYEMAFNGGISATFDGANLHINYEACQKCRSYTSCDVHFEQECDPKNASENLPNWLTLKDSFCKNIFIDDDGNIHLIKQPQQEEKRVSGEEILLNGNKEYEDDRMEDDTNEDTNKTDIKSESSLTSHGKCSESNLAKNLRFMVLKRDFTCNELLHRSLIEQYKRDCQWQPWCNISEHETFGDYRKLISILKPVNNTESEKWLMKSKLGNKSKNLTYKDLKQDSDKGFYHWMRPYKRFTPESVKIDDILPPTFPRAFIFRVLEEQWSTSDRDELKGARELLNAVLQYRQIINPESEAMMHTPIIDIQDEDEKKTERAVQAIAHRQEHNQAVYDSYIHIFGNLDLNLVLSLDAENITQLAFEDNILEDEHSSI